MRVPAVAAALFVVTVIGSAGACSPSSAAEQSAPTKQELAKRFAQAYFPEDALNAAAARSFEQSATAQFHGQPSAMALEQKAPGMIAAAVAAGRPFAIERQARITRETQQREAELFAQRLSQADLLELVAIFESPNAAALVQRGVAGAAAAPATGTLTPEQRIKAGSAAARSSASAKESALMMRFMRSEASKHLSAIFPEMKAIALDVQSNVDRELERRSLDAMQQAAATHVAKFGLTIAH